jgi:porin
MAVGSKLFICSVFALIGLGCASRKDAVWSEQSSPKAVPHIALQYGSFAAGLDGNGNTGNPGSSRDPAGVAGEVPLGPLGAGRVDRGVKLASLEPQDSVAPGGTPPGPAGPSTPGNTNSTSTVGPTAPANPGTASSTGDGAGGGTGAAEGQGTPPVANAVSGNPAATNIVAGTGRLGELLGINQNGIRFGGLTINDANGNVAGGLGPGKWTGDTLTIADLSIDLEKFAGWKGAMVGTQFLYYNGFGPGYSISNMVQGKNNPNALAGTVMGFNSLSAAPPFSRAELYELWFRQEFFDKKLIVRIGKSVPTYDFNNVVRAVPLSDPQGSIPAISSALFTPLYVNPTLLGVIPGYYNSATGVVASWIPNDNSYLTYGFFDGNLARGEQTGFDGPRFNGYYLHLAEGGVHWRIGEDQKPGKFGAGAWFQTGKFHGFDGRPLTGANGIYLFGSQRLYYENPAVSNNGLLSWVQFGATNSDIVLTHRYFGFGLTYFGLLPSRDEDSCGFGLAWGTMTRDPQAGLVFFGNDNLRTNQLGANEVILTWYYQMTVREGIYIQPNLSYIPDPAQHPGIPGSFNFTMRGIVLF